MPGRSAGHAGRVYGNAGSGCRIRPLSGPRAAGRPGRGTCRAAGRHPGQRLQHDPVGEERGDLGVVVGRRHLDDVHADDGQLQADPAYGVEQLPRGQAARLRGARAGRVAGVADVDVDGEEDPVALVERDLERLGRGRRRARACRSRSSRRTASAARPSTTASPAAASSRAARSAGTGRRAGRRTRSAGASAGRARRASRTRCRRCRRARRSAASTPGRSRGAGPPRWRRAGRWCGRRRGPAGMAPAAVTVCTAVLEAAIERSTSPENISTSPASTTRRSCSASTRSARCGRDPSCGR